MGAAAGVELERDPNVDPPDAPKLPNPPPAMTKVKRMNDMSHITFLN